MAKDSKNSSVWTHDVAPTHLNSSTFQDPNQKMLTFKDLSDTEQIQFRGSMNGLFDGFQKNAKEFTL